MGDEMNKFARRYLLDLPAEDRFKILVAALDRLIELEEVRFDQDDADKPDGFEERLYWTASGTDLRDD